MEKENTGKEIIKDLKTFENNIKIINESGLLFEINSLVIELDKSQEKLESINEKLKELDKNLLGKFNKEKDTLLEHKGMMISKIAYLKNDIDKKTELIKTYNNYTKNSIDKINAIKEELDPIKEKFNKIKSIVNDLEIKANEVQKHIQNLYDISKIIARVQAETLEFIILDTGSLKSAFGYLKQVKELNELKIGYEKVKIIIYSYADHRAEILENEFIKVIKDKEKAIKTMKEYNVRTENSPTKSDFYIAAENVVDNTPDFEVVKSDEFLYMGKYKEIISSSNKSIKRKDVKSIENLIEELNSL